MPELFGLCVKAETKNKVKSIEISLEQTAADEVKDQYANEYGICIHDTNEWLLVSSEGTITYNRRIAHAGRVSLQYELKDTVAEFLKVYDDQSMFSHPKGHSPDTVQDEVRKTYRIVVTRDSGDTSVLEGLEGSFDKDGLPDNWADFVGRLKDFLQGQSLGMLLDSRVYSKVLRKSNEVAFCGVDIDWRGENTLLPLWGRNLRGRYGRGPDTDEAHIGYRTGCRNSVLSQRPDSERDGAGTRDSGPCQRNRIGKRKKRGLEQLLFSCCFIRPEPLRARGPHYGHILGRDTELCRSQCLSGPCRW